MRVFRRGRCIISSCAGFTNVSTTHVSIILKTMNQHFSAWYGLCLFKANIWNAGCPNCCPPRVFQREDIIIQYYYYLCMIIVIIIIIIIIIMNSETHTTLSCPTYLIWLNTSIPLQRDPHEVMLQCWLGRNGLAQSQHLCRYHAFQQHPFAFVVIASCLCALSPQRESAFQ